MTPRLIVAGAGAALLCGLLEALWLALDVGPTPARLIAAMGAHAALAPLWIACAAGLLLSARIPALRGLVDRLRGSAWSAAWGGVIGAALGAIGVIAGTRLGLTVVAAGLKDAALLPPLSAVVVLGALIVGGGAGLLAAHPLGRLFDRFPKRPAMLVSGLLVLLAAGGVLRPAWRLVFTARSGAPVWLGLIAVGAAAWLVRRRWGWRVALPALALVAGVGWIGLRTLLTFYPILGPIRVNDAVAQRVVEVAERLTDADGDGASWLIMRADCDDTDPTVRPGAGDIPDNGIDEDCDGQDATAAAVTREPVAHHPLPKAFQRRQKWNVLLVTIDTLRPDRLGAYGHDRPTSPHIDRLAQDGFVFEYVWAAASKTSDSVPAMLSGRFVSEMDLDRRSKPALVLPSNDLLAERFERAGWFTQGAWVKMFQEAFWFGMDQGIERVDVSPIDFTRVSAPDLTTRTIRAWDAWDQAQDPRPFFSWVHFHEPHAAYVKHEGFDFGDDDIDRYDSEVAFVDAQVGRLMQALQDRNLTENTIVVITSDHGEAFREHGQPYHGRALWEEAVRIPLIIRVPGVKGHRVGGPVSLVDLPETLANLAGIEPGDAPSAMSLVRAMATGGKVAPHDIWIDSILHQDKPDARLLGLVRWPFKAVLDFRNGRLTLFNLADDPKEQTDLAKSQPKRAAQMARLIRDRMTAYNQGEVARALEGRRFSEPPEGVPAKGIEIAEGVEWLGGRFEQSEKRRFRLLRNYFRATGARRPDYTVRVIMKDSTGRWELKRDLRPVVGRYPTHRWREGEIVEDIRWVKSRGKPPYSVQFVLKRGRKQMGPLRDVVADPLNPDAAAPASAP